MATSEKATEIDAGAVVLVLAPLADVYGVPELSRLRRLLKAMRRGYGWRAVSVADRFPPCPQCGHRVEAKEVGRWSRSDSR